MDLELLELQKEYLNDLPEKLDRIYELLLNIENEVNQVESLNNLKGVIHSIKGSSGSYEINFISELCHNFEDNLEFFEKGQDKKNLLINCFHYYELMNEFIEAYQPGKKQDLASFYEKLNELKHGGKLKVSKREKIKENRLNEVLICTEDIFFRDAILLSLAKQNANLTCINDLKSLKKDQPVEIVFLVSPKKQVFELLSNTNIFQPKIQVITLVQENKKQQTPQDFPYVLITHHLIKDIRKEYCKALKKIESSLNNDLSKLEKILFVDDDESIHPLVKMAFKKYKNIDMVYCHSAKEAQNALANFTPDLIILDSMMPEISGKEFKKSLSKDDKLKAIPVLFLTGLDSKKEIDELKKIGAVDVILKPFKIKALAEKILGVWSNIKAL